MHITLGEIMKNIKYILTSFLVLLAVCSPFVLTGCTRYYHIEAFVRQGSGFICVSTDNSNGGSGSSVQSIVGKITDVGNDKNFKYEVGPSANYEIEYIKENGEVIYDVNLANNQVVPNDKGNVTCNIQKEEITKDIKIEVAFRLRTVYLEYWYKNETGDGYSPLKVNGNVYKTEAKSGEGITLAIGWDAFEFVLEVSGAKVEFLNGVSKIHYSNNANTGKLYTDKSQAELKTYLGLS